MPNSGMRYQPSLRTLSKDKFIFNIRASLLDILEAGDIYYKIDEIILKMRKAEPLFFVILPIKIYKNSELMFCFPLSLEF